MQAIKKVLHKDQDTSPSGFFKTESNDEPISATRHHDSTTSGTSAHNTSARNTNSTAGAGISATSAAAAGADTAHRRQSDVNAESDRFEQTAPPPKPAHEQPRDLAHVDKDTSKAAEHDHKHLAPVTHHKHQIHETEEVTRQRDVDRHVHHVQHHVQPVHDTRHEEHKHHERVHPTTEVYEKHVSTDQDKAALAGLSRDSDTKDVLPKERVVVDKGEIVNENVHHHVHHVVQPTIMRDTHEHHTVHTTIPTHQTVHEAPIVHQSVQHEPMHIKDFQAGGGQLDSKLSSDTAGVLNTNDGECVRRVDGPAEKLLEKLHINQPEHREHTNVQQGQAL
ncbi:hypothetical protein OIV83_005201 [Microbotryomycetes sp. JL201]|nr:hypothetical protein OIV83_005201 [Microbotryomycetes sp. JL201]